MPGPGEPPAQTPAPIIGRDAALARVRGLIDPVPQSSQVLLVIGEAGIGKTELLADAAARARSSGTRVLSVTGRESESKLAFAGLHQLLRPVLSRVAGLPSQQAQALLGAFGLAADPGAPDPLLTRVAVLTLLSDLSERSPVLVIADDAQWLAGGAGLRRQPPGRRADRGAGRRPGTGPAARLRPGLRRTAA
jgi:AAA ATPase domain